MRRTWHKGTCAQRVLNELCKELCPMHFQHFSNHSLQFCDSFNNDRLETDACRFVHQHVKRVLLNIKFLVKFRDSCVMQSYRSLTSLGRSSLTPGKKLARNHPRNQSTISESAPAD